MTTSSGPTGASVPSWPPTDTQAPTSAPYRLRSAGWWTSTPSIRASRPGQMHAVATMAAVPISACLCQVEACASVQTLLSVTSPMRQTVSVSGGKPRLRNLLARQRVTVIRQPSFRRLLPNPCGADTEDRWWLQLHLGSFCVGSVQLTTCPLPDSADQYQSAQTTKAPYVAFTVKPVN